MGALPLHGQLTKAFVKGHLCFPVLGQPPSSRLRVEVWIMLPRKTSTHLMGLQAPWPWNFWPCTFHGTVLLDRTSLYLSRSGWVKPRAERLSRCPPGDPLPNPLASLLHHHPVRHPKAPGGVPVSEIFTRGETVSLQVKCRTKDHKDHLVKKNTSHLVRRSLFRVQVKKNIIVCRSPSTAQASNCSACLLHSFRARRQ